MAFICTQDLKDEEYINSHYVIMATKRPGQENIFGAIFTTPIEWNQCHYHQRRRCAFGEI